MRATLIKLAVFVAVASALGTLVFGTLGGGATGPTDTFHAVFADVSGLRVGDPVRVSGVKVGQVTGEKLRDATHVDLTFTANHDQDVTTTTYAVVRYANLLGQRFLALTRGDDPGRRLPKGATIPQQRTAPALSLTTLFNGFQPLFDALDPGQVNALSGEIVQVVQGQSGTIDDLLATTADLTANLADRDQLFAQVLDGMSSVLQTVSQHDAQLGTLLASLHRLTSGLAADTPAIDSSLGGIDALMSSVDGLLTQLQSHSFGPDVRDLNSVTGTLAANQVLLDQLVKGFPTAFADFARVSQNGNWINTYLCGTIVRTSGTATITAADVGSLAGLPPALVALLTLLPIGAPLPLTVPNGTAGSGTAHTAVCR
ncbi:MAG: phospholipid/cholesterol/gamma-HCH transport system substrate-binding protein [Pseudonocardiales bacterium]|nr:phospholipid/cholesterol/gamma-HCH transport system substrate-binding protein [Pseudonocardiales bacterium]